MENSIASHNCTKEKNMYTPLDAHNDKKTAQIVLEKEIIKVMQIILTSFDLV